MRDAYSVPRNTRTFILDNLLPGHSCIKTELMLRYAKFYRGLLDSPVPEARYLAARLRTYVSSVSGANLKVICDMAGVDPLAVSREDLRNRLDLRREVPTGEDWILDKLNYLISESIKMKYTDVSQEDRDLIQDTIDCLCCS